MTTHLLVVDDSPVERHRIRFLLQQQMPHALVTFAENGQMAVESLSAFTPDLIVSDMRMPEMNGLELVKQLQATRQNIPVILMTGYGSEAIAVQALHAGASSYVPKSELESNLVPTVDNLLSISQVRQNRRRVLEHLTSAEVRYTIENDATLVTALVSHILDQVLAMKLLEGQKLTRIGVALQEALSNAIHHGNLELDSDLRQEDEIHYYALGERRRRQSPFRERRVSVIATLSQREVRFTVADEGPGFDFERLLNSSENFDFDRIGGRGLLLIRSFMDQLSFNHRGNELTMTMSCADTSPMRNGPHTGRQMSDSGSVDSLMSMPAEELLVTS